MATTQDQIDKKIAKVAEKRAELRSLQAERESAAQTASLQQRSKELDVEDAALTAQIKAAKEAVKAQKGATVSVEPNSAVPTAPTDEVKAKTKADPEDSTSGTVRN